MIIMISFTNIIEGLNNCAILNYYNSKLNSIKNFKAKMDLGYTPNNYIYNSFLVKSGDPLPVNANFWFHEY